MPREGLQVGLAISLHAATDEERSRLLPVNQRYPLADLMDAVRDYVEHTGRRVTFEWALIRGENDTPEQAAALGRLLQGLLCHVNLIPLNPTGGYDGAPSDPGAGRGLPGGTWTASASAARCASGAASTFRPGAGSLRRRYRATRPSAKRRRSIFPAEKGQRMPRAFKIAPSILSADFTRLGEQVREIEAAGAELIHVDIMDGHFVPNISFGPMLVEAVRRVTRLPLDTHLMIEKPERYLKAFVEAGATMLTVHVETCPHLHRTLSEIKALGIAAGVALNPHTPFEMVRDVLAAGVVDRVLVMTVNPGFGGQSFLAFTMLKVAQVRRALDEVGRAAEIGWMAALILQPRPRPSPPGRIFWSRATRFSARRAESGPGCRQFSRPSPRVLMNC